MKKIFILFLITSIYSLFINFNNINAQTSNFYVYNNSISTPGSFNNRVVKRDIATNNFLADAVIGFENITELKVDELGNIYVSNNAGEVYKLDSDFNLIWVNDDSGNFISGMFLDNNGFVYTSNTADDAIRKIDPNGNLVWTYAFGNDVFNIFVDNNGFVYGAGRDRVNKLDSSGNQIWSYPSSGIVFNVVVDSNDNVYFIDRGNYEFIKLNNNGNLIYSIASGLSVGFSRSLAIDYEDNIYHMGPNENIIKRNPSGNVLQTFSNTHTGNTLNQIEVDLDLNLYTSSFEIARVFESSGTLLYNNTDALPHMIYHLQVIFLIL